MITQMEWEAICLENPQELGNVPTEFKSLEFCVKVLKKPWALAVSTDRSISPMDKVINFAIAKGLMQYVPDDIREEVFEIVSN